MEFAFIMVEVLYRIIQKQLDITSCQQIEVIQMINLNMENAFIMVTVLSETIRKRLYITRCQQIKVIQMLNLSMQNVFLILRGGGISRCQPINKKMMGKVSGPNRAKLTQARERLEQTKEENVFGIVLTVRDGCIANSGLFAIVEYINY